MGARVRIAAVAQIDQSYLLGDASVHPIKYLLPCMDPCEFPRPKRHRFCRFAWFTVVTMQHRQTDRQTDGQPCNHDVLQKEDDDWVKKCMEYEVQGPRHRGRLKRT